MSGEVGLRTGNTNTIDLTFIILYYQGGSREGRDFFVCLCSFKTLLTFPALFLCGPGRSPRAAFRATRTKWSGLAMDGTDLGHEACPAAGGVVDGVQLLHEGGGVREGVVSLQQTLDQLTVCGV